MPLGVDNIVLPSEEEQQRMFDASRQPQRSSDGRRKWRRGEMEFEALMRQLDNAVSSLKFILPSAISRDVTLLLLLSPGLPHSSRLSRTAAEEREERRPSEQRSRNSTHLHLSWLPRRGRHAKRVSSDIYGNRPDTL